TPHPDPPPRGGREILDLAKCRAAGGFSLAGATKYFCHERLIWGEGFINICHPRIKFPHSPFKEYGNRGAFHNKNM
ncbi:MAG: hypothetical protein COX16_01720, partial [Deltaproteobacteria bacterium CG23_combo_of_CG06-09_8_20_14_all_51_20]